MSESIATPEEWRSITGLEGSYEVSDRGRVRSLPRVVVGKDGVRYRRRGQMLKPVLQPTGYYTVGVRQKVRTIHSLVAEAFIGPRPDGLEVCHNNGHSLDNRAQNLRYGTTSENQVDSVLHGTNYQAAKTHCPQNHPYDDANTMIRSHADRRPSRYCRTCHQDRQRERGRRIAVAKRAA